MGYFRVIFPLFLVYLALTLNLELSNLVLGGLLAIGLGVLVRPTLFVHGAPQPQPWRRLPYMLWAVVRYLAFLAWDIWLSGLQVARLVLAPKLNLQPGIIAIPTQTKSEMAIALSAHAITITPGEMVLEISRDGVLYTHCLDGTKPDVVRAEAQRLRETMLQDIV